MATVDLNFNSGCYEEVLSMLWQIQKILERGCLTDTDVEDINNIAQAIDYAHAHS